MIENQTITIESLSLEQLKSLLFMLMECEKKQWFQAAETEETNEILHIICSEIAFKLQRKLKEILPKKRKKKYSIKLKQIEICCFISVFEGIRSYFGPFEQSIIQVISHQYDHWKKNQVEFITSEFLQQDSIVNNIPLID